LASLWRSSSSKRSRPLKWDIIGDNTGFNNKRKNQNQQLTYRYDRLIGEGGIKTYEDKIIDFVRKKKNEGLGANGINNGINNWINQLRKFNLISGIKGIEWELIGLCVPENIKKSQDREYRVDEVIAIEEKLDVKGKVVSRIMRGSGVRRGAEPYINAEFLDQH
jgi:hypothetical protein